MEHSSLQRGWSYNRMRVLGIHVWHLASCNHKTEWGRTPYMLHLAFAKHNDAQPSSASGIQWSVVRSKKTGIRFQNTRNRFQESLESDSSLYASQGTERIDTWLRRRKLTLNYPHDAYWLLWRAVALGSGMAKATMSYPTLSWRIGHAQLRQETRRGATAAPAIPAWCTAELQVGRLRP